MSGVQSFYDPLADVYDLIYEDWPASIEAQGTALDALIRQRCDGATTVADVACGIGTQALALAGKGYRVVASDVTPGAIERAKREAAARGLVIELRLDDMRELSTFPSGSADVLIACDNAVPHLLTDDEIARAFSQFHRVLRPGGLSIISVRDYAAMPRQALRFVPFGVRDLGATKVSISQMWEYEGERYRLNMYFTFDDGEKVETRVFRARYYAISIDRLIEIFEDAGFRDVERIDGTFFQPLIAARRP